tara:strand:+ start:78 stop:371 length:294 start_codon:yes stop_codon:yes gene_type:complete
MNSLKIALLALVIFVIYCIFDNIESFQIKKLPQYRQVQGLPFTNELVDKKLYMCKDKNDIIGSCHGIGVIPEVFNKYKNSIAHCPYNWLLPGNSIYK